MVSYESFSAGTVTLEVRPELSSDFRADLARQLATINDGFNVEVGADFTGFRQAVTAEVDWAGMQTVNIGMDLDSGAFRSQVAALSAASDFTIDVGIDADFTSFRGELAALEQSVQSTIDMNLSLDTGVAAAELEAFLAAVPRSITIHLDLDTAVAANELAAFLAAIPRRRTIDVDIDTHGGVGALGNLNRSADDAQRKLRGMGSIKFGAITAGIGALAGEIVGLVGAAGGAVAALGAIGAVGFIGSKGLGDAFTAASEATASAGDDAKASAEAQAVALDGVVAAQDGVESAQRGVLAAERDATSAQKSLNDAYRDANRELRDMNVSLKDAELSQEGAAIAVARARENLARVKKDPKSSRLDLQEADLAVRTAEQRYSSSKTTTSDLRSDTSGANRAGVEGSDRVQNAQQQVKDSAQGVTDANKDAAQSIKDLANAQKELAEAGESAGSGQDKLAEALAKLSPNARDFFEKVRALGPAWKDLRLQVQDDMFAGLGDSFTELANNQMPALQTGMSTIASGINVGLKDTFAELDSTFTNLVDAGTMDKFTAGTADAMKGLAPLVGGLTDAFITMGAEVGPALGPLFASIGDMFRDLGPSLGDIGRIFTESLTDVMPALGSFIGALADGLGPVLPVVADLLSTLFTALEPLIPPLSDFLVIVGESLIEALDALAPAIGPLGEAFVSLIDAISPILPMAAELIATMVEALAPALETIFDALGPVIEQWLDGMKPVLEKLAPIIADVAMQLGTALADALKQIAPVLPILTDAFSRIVVAVAPFIPQLSEMILDLLPPLIDLFVWLVENVLPPVVTAFEWLAEYVFPLVIGGVREFVDEWVDNFNEAREFLDTVKTNIGDAIGGIKDFFTDLGDSISIIWKGIVGSIAVAVEQIGKLIKKIDLPDWIPVIGGNSLRNLGTELETWGAANKFADGGPITGPGGPRDDVIPAWLSAGEYVVQASAVAKHRPLIEAINQDTIPGFADGGLVGGTVANGSTLTSDIQSSMWDAIRGVFPDIILTSGTRSEDVGSGYDNHMAARAIDLDGPNMPDYARWIYGLNQTQQVEELIHAPLDGWENLKKGAPLNFGSATDAQHEDHVHWAMATPVGPIAPPDSPTSTPPAASATPDTATSALDTSTDAITGMGDTSGASNSTSTASTWSGLAGGVAEAFVSGYVSDTLGVFGIPDGLPPIVKAGQMLWDLTKDGSSSNGEGANVADSPAGTAQGVGVDPTAPSAPAASEQKLAGNPYEHTYDPSGGAQQWKSVVEAVFNLGGWAPSGVDNALDQMDIESSGNPFATNPSFNAPGNGGIPSGLMQTVPNTFKAFKSLQLLDDIFDPAANIYAAANYVMTDPKFNGAGIENVWPTAAGYVNGGSVWGRGTPTSDSIPAWLSDREFVVNARSADANRPLLDAINSDANAVNSSIAPMFAGIRRSSTQSTTSIDNSMTVNLTTSDTQSAFSRAKTMEAQRSMSYATPGR